MKAWIANILLLTIASLIILLIIECAVRIFFPLYPSVYQPDPILLEKLVPNSKRIFVREKGNGGQKITVTINSLGFRGEEFSITHSKERVVVYGDSFIEGEFSSLENTFVKQLEKRLNATGTDSVEVINDGVVGYGPDQEALKIQQELDSLKPDLVIVALFAGNDFGDLLRDKIYKLDANNQLTLNNYSLNASLRSEMIADAFPKGLYHLQFFRRLKKLYSRLVLQDKCESIEGSFKCCEEEYVDYVLKNNNEVTNLFGDHYDTDVALAPDAPSSLYKINLIEKVILKMQQIVGSKGIPMVLLITPSPIDVCDNYDYQVDQSRYKQYKRSRLTDILETIAKQYGIKYLNLFQPFRQTDCNKLYFHFGDDHWNDNGQRLAAELMQRFLRINFQKRFS